MGGPIDYDEARLAEVLSPEYFVRVRTTPGGPAPVETARAIAASRERLAVDEDWMRDGGGEAAARRGVAERAAVLELSDSRRAQPQLRS